MLLFSCGNLNEKQQDRLITKNCNSIDSLYLVIKQRQDTVYIKRIDSLVISKERTMFYIVAGSFTNKEGAMVLQKTIDFDSNIFKIGEYYRIVLDSAKTIISLNSKYIKYRSTYDDELIVIKK
jgi:hypothetical protein